MLKYYIIIELGCENIAKMMIIVSGVVILYKRSMFYGSDFHEKLSPIAICHLINLMCSVFVLLCTLSEQYMFQYPYKFHPHFLH